MPIFGSKKPRKIRPHPYKDEISGSAEETNQTKFAILWFLAASGIVILGFLLNQKYSSHYGGGISNWTELSYLPLFIGLLLMGTHFVKEKWSHYTTIAGWVIFGFYWALVARDQSDAANFAFAALGAYLSSYLAYHEWLNLVRGVRSHATKFLTTATFMAAGTYFLIAAIAPFRIGLINIVGNHTKWMLDLFGAGDEKGLVFVVDKTDILGPVTFFYPEKYCNPHRADEVGTYCADNDYGIVTTYPAEPTNWFQELLQYTPETGIDALRIIPVSIILACTAIQSIMLFVGLFFGTEASLKRKVIFSLGIGALIYVLNLFRNTMIIWFYGLGFTSFWFIHDIIGKGLSLAALVGIAAICFRKFPEFFDSLGSVLDMVHRDGPIERAFGIGRRRPNPDGSPRVQQHELRKAPGMVGFLSAITANVYAWRWSEKWMKALDEERHKKQKNLITVTILLLVGGLLSFWYGANQIVSWDEIDSFAALQANQGLFYGLIALLGYQILLALQVSDLAKMAGKPMPWILLGGIVPLLAAYGAWKTQQHLEETTDWHTGKFAPTMVPANVEGDGSISEA